MDEHTSLLWSDLSSRVNDARWRGSLLWHESYACRLERTAFPGSLLLWQGAQYRHFQRTAQTMPLLLLNARNYQGVLAIMHVGIKNCGVAGTANMCAANMGGKHHETSGRRPSLAYDSRPQFVGVLLDVDLREIPRYFRKRMISSPIACVSFLR